MNNYRPDELQTLFLWALLFNHGGEGWLGDIKPALKSPSVRRRKELEENGLITVEKRQNRLFVTLTEAGWSWANGHLDSPVSKRATTSGLVLENVLRRVKAYLLSKGGSLAELMTSRDDLQPEGNIAERLRNSYLALSDGELNVRVRLADLRDRHPEIAAEKMERTLRELQTTSELVLYPLDNPMEITERDREAAIEIAGEPAYIVYWRK